jgi:hypothetical protein
MTSLREIKDAVAEYEAANKEYPMADDSEASAQRYGDASSKLAANASDYLRALIAVAEAAAAFRNTIVEIGCRLCVNN